MNADKDRIRLLHRSDAITELLSFTNGVSKNEFLNTPMLRLACVKEIEIIGEASRSLSEQLRNKWVNIPWVRIIAFRNILVHEYFQIELEIVWNVIQNEIPDLKKNIDNILSKYD